MPWPGPESRIKRLNYLGANICGAQVLPVIALQALIRGLTFAVSRVTLAARRPRRRGWAAFHLLTICCGSSLKRSLIKVKSFDRETTQMPLRRQLLARYRRAFSISARLLR